MEKTYRYLVEGDLIKSGDQRCATDGTWFDTVCQGGVITKFYADRRYYRREVVEQPPEEVLPTYKPHYIFLDPEDIVQAGDEFYEEPYDGFSEWKDVEVSIGRTPDSIGWMVRRKVNCSGPAMG